MIGLYKILQRVKDMLLLKSIMVINPIIGWFEITQYNDKREIIIVNLVENLWLVMYPWPVDIMYY